MPVSSANRQSASSLSPSAAERTEAVWSASHVLPSGLTGCGAWTAGHIPREQSPLHCLLQRLMQDVVNLVDGRRRQSSAQAVRVESLTVEGRQLGQLELADQWDDVQPHQFAVSPVGGGS